MFEIYEKKTLSWSDAICEIANSENSIFHFNIIKTLSSSFLCFKTPSRSNLNINLPERNPTKSLRVHRARSWKNISQSIERRWIIKNSCRLDSLHQFSNGLNNQHELERFSYFINFDSFSLLPFSCSASS
jgi:hypothetical protein